MGSFGLEALAVQVFALACGTDEYFVPDHELSPAQHRDRLSLDFQPLERIIVHIHMMGLCRQCPFHCRIEDHDISIAAHGNRTLLREQAEQLGA